MTLINLRDLEGVETTEWYFEQYGWTDTTEGMAHGLALHYFGICEDDINLTDEHFPVLRMMRDESDAYWAKHGWDVTDGAGRQLAVMEYLTRPMVCMVEKLHPDAHFAGATKAWGDALAEEARRFKATR